MSLHTLNTIHVHLQSPVMRLPTTGQEFMTCQKDVSTTKSTQNLR